ncbi:MAG: AAA family ATPase, partial [Elusimicrobia bacterium]|nr:AAA family ATPase [Elusimicrobiota bacterium]
PVPAEAVEFVNDEPVLLETQETEDDGERMDFIITPTVKERLDELLTLYSLDHKEKFFPLLIGDTGEGKSTLVKYMFTETLRANPHLGGRTVPVISFPVKETTGGRELLGGNGANGIELGALAMAVKHGYVLVLEELNMANGEFLKSLNNVLQQISMLGYFEFEVGGQSIRIQAHPHFWIVGTENDSEGNYAYTRNEHSPDFVKRWIVNRYGRIPPSEQATIMRGLAMRWAAKHMGLPKEWDFDFASHAMQKRDEGKELTSQERSALETLATVQKYVDGHGLTQAFLEKLVVDFHEPIRKGAKGNSDLGGDLQEPYEFNRRTLHRFLKRYLYDLKYYETAGRAIDDRTRHLLLARELMEAYGSEVRDEPAKKSIWDEMNTHFALTSQHHINRENIEIKVRGLYQKDGKLIVDEQLVPLVMRMRGYDDKHMPGPKHRLTLIPSLAANVYRNLRNRQFRQHQLFTGPTGTGKTRESFFVSHLLKEPLFSLSVHDQLPLSTFHGGFVRKRPEAMTVAGKPVAEILPKEMLDDMVGTLRKAIAGALNMEQTELVNAMLKKLALGGPAADEFKFLAGILARAMMYDPFGLLKRGPDGKLNMTMAEIRNNPDIGAGMIFDEANAATIIESVNPALDFGVLILSDGHRAAVAGGGFNATLAMNPVGEGYAGYPLSSALRSRTQTVHHGGNIKEDELAELLLDEFTGVKRWKLLPGTSGAR